MWYRQQWWSPCCLSCSRSSMRKLCSLVKPACVPYTSSLVKFRHSSCNANLYWLYFTFFLCCRSLKLCCLFARPFLFPLLGSCAVQAQCRPPGRTDQYLHLVHSLVWHMGRKQIGRALISIFTASSKASSWQAVLDLREGKWDVGRHWYPSLKCSGRKSSLLADCQSLHGWAAWKISPTGLKHQEIEIAYVVQDSCVQP